MKHRDMVLQIDVTDNDHFNIPNFKFSMALCEFLRWEKTLEPVDVDSIRCYNNVFVLSM
jgi:hypothetical protein